jgi:secreted PhoX family phosphatase
MSDHESNGHRDTHVDRRRFLTQGALAGAAVTAPLHALLARAEPSGRPNMERRPSRRDCSPDYGALQPVNDATTGLPLLLLPAGFHYLTYGWAGDPLSDGTPTPAAHDGMAAFRSRGGRVRLVRNHEVGSSEEAFANGLAYDPKAGGGTTTLEFDPRRGRFVGSWPSLSGTVRNCAGGPAPWGAWLTCEETLDEPSEENDLTLKHGYVFEVPVFGGATAEPLNAMGRFVHEAVAVDPHTGIVYETEDSGASGFYRFIPNSRGRLAAGGTLQMLAIAGRPQYDTATGQRQGEQLDAEWVTIDQPDPNLPDEPQVFEQGWAKGGARFARLEGAWYGNGSIFFVSTSGGDVEQGQVWEYEPMSETLRLVFESPSAEVLNAPDNICVSPRGGLVLCEDGGGTEFLHGLTTDGYVFRLAQNNVLLSGERNGISGDFTGAEFAGATFSPDGRWLFFNIQSPGITFAVTGPWRAGAL